MIKLFSVIVICIALCGCIDHPVDSSYTGSDAGTLVFSTSSLGGEVDFHFHYRKMGDKGGPFDVGGAGLIACKCQGISYVDPDYVNGKYETERVQIRRLAPGDYEVYTWGFQGGGIGGFSFFAPQKTFSLPFTIRPGQSTYIGNFARAIGPGFYSGGVFVVSDKHERDVELARKKDISLPPVTVQVTDVSQLGQPQIFSRDPTR